MDTLYMHLSRKFRLRIAYDIISQYHVISCKYDRNDVDIFPGELSSTILILFALEFLALSFFLGLIACFHIVLMI